jgi:hypothetical protein|tara:strand:+ start:179 stop:361 length:183 start_codon:yes stop_codon:yes gene_type:complete
MIELIIKLMAAQIAHLHTIKAIEDEYEEFDEEIPLWHSPMDVDYVLEAWRLVSDGELVES